MTGQVKEDVITRFRELGVAVEDGIVSFDPYLLSRDELVSKVQPRDFLLGDREQEGVLASGCLAFSLCGTPVVYRLSESYGVHVRMVDQETEFITGPHLGKTLSRSLFTREKRIQRILVDIPEGALR
jgi:hypothetical protein